jgi:predicted hydrolase (HD superfamily)
MLGISLDDHIQNVITAMQGISPSLGLANTVSIQPGAG